MTKYTTLDVGEKLDYTLGWDDQDWLGDDTIATSAWAIASGGAGLTISGQTNTTTTTIVFGEATAAGTWRLRNSITTSGGRKGVEDIVLTARAATTAAGYLSPEDAEVRLWSRYQIEANLSSGDLEAASITLDYLRPFIGTKLVTDGTQLLEFPRSINPDGTTNEATDPPDEILDWVALCAYRLVTDEPAPVTQESAGSASASYELSKLSQTERRMDYLIRPHLLRMGQRTGTATYVLTENP